MKGILRLKAGLSTILFPVKWYIPFFCGGLFALCQPPFSHETHWLFALNPCGSLIVLIPLLSCSVHQSTKKALWYCYLYGIFASITQLYWIANVTIAGLWPIILAGLGVLILVYALQFVLYGLAFRLCYRFFRTWHIYLYAAIWVVLEYMHTVGDLSFPWAFLGYNLIPILPLAQCASITGVYGLSFIAVVANCLLFEILRYGRTGNSMKLLTMHAVVYGMLFFSVCVYGCIRLSKTIGDQPKDRICLLQTNLDQMHWDDKASFDNSMTINKKMVSDASYHKPDLLIFAESGIYCYLEYNLDAREQVVSWQKEAACPLIFGTLHVEKGSKNPYYDYSVYNAVFFLDDSTEQFQHYYKIKLLPFSEALPFEGIFPILSRLNLGESDFARGTKHVIYHSKRGIAYAPFLCYEIIYPEFVRKRVENSEVNLLVNVTNDGWFGRSNGPYMHATMARTRAIETGIPLARCANSGISMFVSPFGRILKQTALYTQTMLMYDLPRTVYSTIYRRYGDWFVLSMGILFVIALCVRMLYKIRK